MVSRVELTSPTPTPSGSTSPYPLQTSSPPPRSFEVTFRRLLRAESPPLGEEPATVVDVDVEDILPPRLLSAVLVAVAAAEMTVPSLAVLVAVAGGDPRRSRRSDCGGKGVKEQGRQGGGRKWEESDDKRG